MTETEWFLETDIYRILGHVESMGGMERRLDAFGLACCQRITHLHTDPRTLQVMSLLEATSLYDCSDQEYEWAADISAAASRSFADSSTLLGQARHYAAYAVNQLVRGLHSSVVEYCTWAASVVERMRFLGDDTRADWLTGDNEKEQATQIDLLRCIVGNPFRPVTFDPRWRTETAVALASAIYAERAFDRLPILADALEEAACDHPDVLAHCRGPGPHARGCWVVDGVLGKS